MWGGQFTNIGGQTRSRIAKLSTTGTGAADATWNPNANGTVNTLALSGSDLYVGGFFTTIGGQIRNRIAKLSTTSPGAADATWDPNAGNIVNTLALSGSDLDVGGNFISIGGQTRNRIAKLSTTGTGTTDATWNPNANGIGVRSLALSGSDLYVGGDFTTIGGIGPRNGMALIKLGGSSPLPIELLYFNAQLNNLKTVNLSWATASEINNNYFNVQRSADGYTWETISKVNANKTTTTQHTYSDMDLKPLNGITYYRLMQVDFDGTFTYSNIESLELNAGRSTIVKPNPFTQLVTLQLKEFANIKLIEVYNAMGQLVKSITIEEAEQNSIELDFTSMPTGIYYLKADGVTLNQKLIKQ